jgi:16S rRNA (cytosine967-C5)-methyltransferase
VTRDVPVGYAAREVALERVLTQALRFPDLDITPFDPRALAGHDVLDARDAGLARAIEHAVVRRYLTLIACIRPHLTKKWPLLEKPVQAALLAGAAQILFLDRVPPSAAVDASVEWTKRRLRPGAGGLVNAVLRKVAGSIVERLAGDNALARELNLDHTRRDIVPLADGGAIRLSVEAFSEDAAACLSEKTSHARDLILHWVGAFGFKEAVRLAMHDLVEAPMTITGFDPNSPAMLDRIAPHDAPGFAIWLGSHTELTDAMTTNPQLRVQDPTACATVAGLAKLLPNSPSLVVDLCAGRGTKTRQLATMFPNATIMATDPEENRFDALAKLRERYPNIRPLSPQSIFREAAGKADLLLLDVPCSNSGVLARRPEASYRFSKGRTASVIELQQNICDPAMGLLAPKGVVIYATCSIERGENETQVKRLASRFGLSLVVERTIMPTGMPGESAARYADGGYHALLTKTDARG